MKFFFDENLPLWIASGMREFRQDAVHLLEEFSTGTPDEDWLSSVGERGWTIISKDRRIRYRPAELRAYQTSEVGVFVLMGKNVKGWEIVEQLVRNWRRIKELAEKTNRPFIFKVPPRGQKIERIQF
jgi:predicted nuclease of predicted toxin-antitoxin system